MLCMFPTCFVILKCGEDFYFLLAVHARSGDRLPLLPMKRGSALCFSGIGIWQRVSVENPGEADSGMVYNGPSQCMSHGFLIQPWITSAHRRTTRLLPSVLV